MKSKPESFDFRCHVPKVLSFEPESYPQKLVKTLPYNEFDLAHARLTGLRHPSLLTGAGHIVQTLRPLLTLGPSKRRGSRRLETGSRSNSSGTTDGSHRIEENIPSKRSHNGSTNAEMGTGNDKMFDEVNGLNRTVLPFKSATGKSNNLKRQKSLEDNNIFSKASGFVLPTSNASIESILSILKGTSDPGDNLEHEICETQDFRPLESLESNGIPSTIHDDCAPGPPVDPISGPETPEEPEDILDLDLLVSALLGKVAIPGLHNLGVGFSAGCHSSQQPPKFKEQEIEIATADVSRQCPGPTWSIHQWARYWKIR
eukprot:CAMPEP_0175072396 /NCGR_PEP_ID=MMETSP0052_2-20121109/19882_1 /TAXON_ID=51329 ORGANISM="Polytomella parva, Strain SAG 63-3" /NCGR_SAMPLE_ID=MMETSP0052_2 /ASSEMBLY_ACC=CAM_ASM_000194 /LENGTH=314 /DNA_ID=CAMNT_0016339887 /DNA_START=72 /DNA_END=1012 /DNA_ORIENTATION=-